VVDTNLKGTFLCCREAFHTFFAHKENRGGAVVNITADVQRGFPGMAHTGAARAGVENLTRSLAVEWSPKVVLFRFTFVFLMLLILVTVIPCRPCA
jgi:peroxisomal trans-2-enoyl-CoA reductase